MKRGGLTVQDVYQAKMYKELLGATFRFLVGMELIPEELERLLRRIPIMLISAGDYTFNFLALARLISQGARSPSGTQTLRMRTRLRT